MLLISNRRKLYQERSGFEDLRVNLLLTFPEGTATPEEVRAAHIKGVLPRFNAGREFKKVLDTIEFVKTSEPAAPQE